jgi:hypothetical protein
VTSYTTAEFTAILIQVVIVLVIVRRSYAMTQGVPFSLARLVVMPALILVLWGITELESTLLTPWAIPYLIVLDLAILIVSGFAFIPVAERMTQVTREPSGDWSYRIGFSLAALFLGAFLIRLTVAVLLFPSALAFGSSPGGFPPEQQQVVLGVIDALFSLSAGLLAARSIGIHRKWKLARAIGSPGGAS